MGPGTTRGTYTDTRARARARRRVTRRRVAGRGGSKLPVRGSGIGRRSRRWHGDEATRRNGAARRCGTDTAGFTGTGFSRSAARFWSTPQGYRYTHTHAHLAGTHSSGRLSPTVEDFCTASTFLNCPPFRPQAQIQDSRARDRATLLVALHECVVGQDGHHYRFRQHNITVKAPVDLLAICASSSV
jgi:hypothetical protein